MASRIEAASATPFSLALPGHEPEGKAMQEALWTRHGGGSAGYRMPELNGGPVPPSASPSARIHNAPTAAKGSMAHAAGVQRYKLRSAPPADDNIVKSGKKIIDARAKDRPSFAPFATGEAADEVHVPPAAATPAARVPPHADTHGESLAKISDGSAARLAAAFAKRDTQRQGKLAPADFAAAIRELGVPLSEGSVRGAGVGGHACSNLSNDTIDYLKFIQALSPHVGGVASAAASAAWSASALPSGGRLPASSLPREPCSALAREQKTPFPTPPQTIRLPFQRISARPEWPLDCQGVTRGGQPL